MSKAPLRRYSDDPLGCTAYDRKTRCVCDQCRKGSIDGNHYYRVDTAQDNGWVRVNCYYADGQQDETFERGDEK